MAHKSTVNVGWILLLCLIAIGGCAAGEPLDMRSSDHSQDQKALASYYRNQAAVMREKADGQATAVTRYEALFGPESSLVSGARSLASFYEHTAEEFERLAEAPASADRAKRPTAAP